MKKIVSLVFISMLMTLAACSDNGEESSSYEPSDYEFSGVSTSSEEVELFQEEEKALYLYFTGVE